MCGILGEVRKLPAERGAGASRIRPILGCLRHRGPDGEGVWEDAHVTLGHRRLSIIDLTDAASQPMVDRSSGVAMTFNGEIYNYLEIRKELASRGHIFRGTGDGEVLLRGFLEFGEEILTRLNGMFAFAIWDPRIKKLFCARDPVGQKPMFFHHGSLGFLFGSELASLARHPWITKQIDRLSLARFLAFDHNPAPQTILEGIHKLPPGHAIQYDPLKSQPKIYEYKNCAAKHPARLGKKKSPDVEDFQEFDQILKNALIRHIRSDVPVGAFLSGGVDSTLISCLATEILGKQLSTFTVRFTDASYNEADQAMATAKALGTTHYEKTISEKHATNHIPDFIRRTDEPLADLGFLALHEVVQFAADKVKVVLSGDGGDEFFYGYEPFLKWGASEALNLLPPLFVNGCLRPFARKHAGQFGYMEFFYKMHIFLRGYRLPAAFRNMSWVGGFLPEEIGRLLRPEVLAEVCRKIQFTEKIYEPVLRLFEDCRGLSSLDRLGVEYQKIYLPGVICAHTDKATMASSIEGRSPFLDSEVVDFANRIPWQWKVRQGKGKWFLRAYLAEKLKKSPVAYLRKHGYTVPMARWLRSNLKDFCCEVLSRDFQEQLGFFEPKEIERILHQHLDGRVNCAKQLWPIMVFSCWAEEQGLRA